MSFLYLTKFCSSLVSVYGSCISFLLLCNKLQQTYWLKTTYIYYFKISVHQKSRHSLAGLSASGSYQTEIQVSGWTAVSSQAWLRRDPLTSLFRLLTEFISCGCRTEGPVSLLAIIWGLLSIPRGHPQFIAMWPLHRLPHNMAAYFLKTSKGEKSSLIPVCLYSPYNIT